MALFWIGVKDDAVYRNAYFSYLPVTALGLVIAAIGGFVPMPARVWVWMAAIVADLAATQFAQRGDWALKAGHFAERHGLIVIIALGESIIAVGVGLYLGAIVVNAWWARRIVLRARLVGIGSVGAVAFLAPGVTALGALVFVTVGVLGVAISERRAQPLLATTTG